MPQPRPSSITPAERTRAWRAARKAEGGREVTVMLTPENAAWFDAQRAACPGMTYAEFINAVIAAEREGVTSPPQACPSSPTPA